MVAERCARPASASPCGQIPPGRRTAKLGASRCIHAADGNQLSQERNGNAKLRDQLARVQQQNQRLQDEHRQSQLTASDAEQQIAALETELAQQRKTSTRESPTPVSTVRETTAHVDQTPRPMASYGYWASPSGYRYGGRW